MAMLIVSFFTWWYGPGWWLVIDSFKPRFKVIRQEFSTDQLLRTLFAPWRRIISEPGRTPGDRLRAWSDNLFSRIIGFLVRLFVLLVAALAFVLITILTAIEIVIWPLLPLAVPGCIIAGLIV